MTRLVTMHLKYAGPGPGSAAMGQRAFNELVRSAAEDMGEEWHLKMMPRHFETSAPREYRYQPRTKPYMLQKARKKGHQRPLEWSGELKLVSRVKRVVATATSAKVGLRVVLPMASKANWKRSARSPDLREELTVVSEREVPPLAEVHDRGMQTRLDAVRTVEEKEL